MSDDRIPAELLYESLDIGSARGRRSDSDLVCEIVRELEDSDVPTLLAPPPVATPRREISHIRQAHHALARYMALGRSGVEISALTGYSEAYISTLRGDAAFAELVAYYQANSEAIFVDVAERMRQVGLESLEMLQERLQTERDEVTRKELREIIELLLVKPLVVRSASAAASPSQRLQIGIAFVKPDDPKNPLSAVHEHVDYIDVETSDA